MIERIRRYFLYKRYRYFVWNLTGGIDHLSRRALLYYKTEPYFNKVNLNNFTHTNLWEINEMVRILNKLGYVVDLVDRSANDFIPEDKYDLFIGLGAGNSGKHFAKYGKALPSAIKVLYAAGPEPNISNVLIRARYDKFRERTGIDAPPMRMITEIDFSSFIQLTDAIFCISEPNNFSYASYEKFGKPISSILPGVSPNIRFSPEWFSSRKANRFLCFAGNGFISKGVDILVEAFLEMPKLELYICGPDSEAAFFKAYNGKIRKATNIHFEGFVKVGGAKFHELAAKCSYTILNSAKEGLATSVATCIRAGLVPIVNPEAGISTGDHGFEIDNLPDEIESTMRIAQIASQTKNDEYRWRVYSTLMASLNYTQESFSRTFSEAVIGLIRKG